jgi:hypothetical protein
MKRLSKKYLKECIARCDAATVGGKEFSDSIAWDLSTRLRKLVKFIEANGSTNRKGKSNNP